MTSVCDVAFVGNFLGVKRPIEDLLPTLTKVDFKVYGQLEPHDHPFRPFHQGVVSPREVSHIYASAKIVVEDITPMVAPWGCLNSRLFEAMASGTPVVTNSAIGLAETVGDAVLVYESPEHFAKLLIKLLGDDDYRRELGQRARAQLIERHTWAHRAESFRGFLAQWSEQARPVLD